MEFILNCPICNEEVYSGVGKGCKMCGMLLNEEDNEFCCKICMRKFNTINKIIERGKII
jgi:hypothetical protein